MVRRIYAVLLLSGAITVASPALTFTTLFSFDGPDGQYPEAPLVQGLDGNLYGTTVQGGQHGPGYGSVFKITPAGALTTIYSFCTQPNCDDGVNPYAGLIVDLAGNFYGTTALGGVQGWGTVFKISPLGMLTTLHSFCSGSGCPDGAQPYGGLVRGNNDILYGTTASGGLNGGGTVFKISPTGTLKTLYNFCAEPGCTDGMYPVAALVQGADGNFYGTTEYGGASGVGTVFKITLGGTLTTLYSFSSTSTGETPRSPLVAAIDGNFYGTTGAGLAIGTFFQITPSGTLTTLYTFNGPAGDPYEPTGIVQATDGNFYGATGSGTIFQITPTGVLTVLTTFPQSVFPQAPPILATNGTFYGTTQDGGIFCVSTQGCGTVFSLTTGLAPFVEPLPTAAKTGFKIDILGTNLTGATSVTFNGVAATFKVVSSSLITTSVPNGATTGTIQVVTRGGTLSSNVPFRVLR